MRLKEAIEYALSPEEPSATTPAPEQPPTSSEPPAGLTSREVEVLKLVLPLEVHVLQHIGDPARLPQDQGRLPHRGHPLRPGTRPGLTAVSTQRSAVSYLFLAES